ncbi:sigma 54-interacting transcriptional regulator [Fictibacillus sp. WQ 8-8]|uniref:sigma-54 interaction domain-containing protein n=1 Tax=Fictibacillus sp. WQ 8-8 TaxID=2938788 RepID=UPI00210CF3B8|nr:sigma 54-interacting transcriptional regulator [Fictibacillus sp. WQ 8-8]MCQ6268351.1 sigma 54-interacting transcriptional regulator [Fictibacillus sp. WQ 8-8]
MPKLVVLSKDLRTFQVFQKQINDFFQGEILILSQDECMDYNEADLILLSSSQLQHEQYPLNKTLIARRAINISKLEELVSLPARTKCLVVNNLPETAAETIELLENLGLNLQLYPYFPGMDKRYKGIEIAIIPAGIELAPKGIKKIIDIGIRPLDFSTLVELSIKLNINIDKANIHSARYIQEIIALSRRLSESYHEVSKLNHQLDAILNTVHDGILATDKENRIIKYNNSAKRILGVSFREEEVIGKKITEIFPKLHLENGLEEESYTDHQLISFNEKKLVVNKSSINIGHNKFGDVTAFQDVTRIQALEQDIRKIIQKKGFSSKYTTEDIIGKSVKIKEIIRIMHKIAKTERTVLILGENGTGKELFAHSIHNMSGRKNGPFIPVNFAGLPESLAESELFGYEEGTFTGAVKGGKQGLFELAHNGTIFLDEIGDASKNLQTLLLRILQEKQVMRVGGRSILPVNVRVIAATNKDLKKLVRDGQFREDLYYRLFVLPLRIPSLKERKEDIPELLNYFIKEYSPTCPEISEEVMDVLINYEWPGNVRELVSAVQYMTTVMDSNVVTIDNLPEQFKAHDERNNEPNDIFEKLKYEGDLRDFHLILSCLFEAKEQRKSIGRGTVVSYSQDRGCLLSEQQVRRRMEVLRDLGLICSGNKGQGSKILDSGIQILNVLEKTSIIMNR